MREIVFLSGKGGAGKTVVSASVIAKLGKAAAVDCDVDASNLHLLIAPQKQIEKHIFQGPLVAIINKDKCVKCGKCIDVCRFLAISKEFVVDSSSCEGCGLCQYVCPQDAIAMEREDSGEWGVYETKYGILVYGDVGPSGENSGKMVSVLKERTRSLASNSNFDFIICDGPPGTGCPVISSLNSVSDVVLVIEATMSGFEDGEKVAQLCRKMDLSPKIVINKWDLNEEVSKRIDNWARKEGLALLGKIGFNEEVVRAVIEGSPPIEISPRFNREIDGIVERLLRSDKDNM